MREAPHHSGLCMKVMGVWDSALKRKNGNCTKRIIGIGRAIGRGIGNTLIYR